MKKTSRDFGHPVRDAVDQAKQTKLNKSESILEQLTYRHSMLFHQLVEAKNRLNNVTLSLGGNYEIERENLKVDGLTEPEYNHVSVYQSLLNSTEIILTDIYCDLERLEQLASK